jgi:hypothetical protein
MTHRLGLLVALTAACLVALTLVLWRTSPALEPGAEPGPAPAASAEGRTAAPLEQSPAALLEAQRAPAAELSNGSASAAPPAAAAAELVLQLRADPFVLRIPLRSDLDGWAAAGLGSMLSCVGAGPSSADSFGLEHGAGGPRLVCAGPGPFEVDIRWPGFVPVRGSFDAAELLALSGQRVDADRTASAASLPAGAVRSEAAAAQGGPDHAASTAIELRLQPAAALRLSCADPEDPAGVRIGYRSTHARLGWALLAAPAGRWSERTLPVPSGPGELWAELQDGRRAVARVPDLAAGQVLELDLQFSEGSAGFVTLYETPSGRPLERGKAFLANPQGPADPNVEIRGLSSGIELFPGGVLQLPNLSPRTADLAIVDSSCGLVHYIDLLWPADAGQSFGVPAPGGLRGELRGAGVLPAGLVVRARRPNDLVFDPVFPSSLNLFEQQLPIPTAVVDAERHFAFERLASGAWNLSLEFDKPGSAGGLESPLGVVQIDSDRVAQASFELPDLPDAALEIEFRLDGQPGAGQTLELMPVESAANRGAVRAQGVKRRPVTTDGEGRAQVQLLPPGRYQLSFVGISLAEFELGRGETHRVSLSAEYGGLLMTLVSPAGEVLSGQRVRLRRRGSQTFRSQTSDGLGRVYLRTLAGPHEAALFAAPAGGSDPSQREGPASPFELLPGERELTLVVSPP